jgi:hypothetical protein
VKRLETRTSGLNLSRSYVINTEHSVVCVRSCDRMFSPELDKEGGMVRMCFRYVPDLYMSVGVMKD